MVLRNTDNISQTLYKPAILAAESQVIAKMVIDSFDKNLDAFWDKVLKKAEMCGVDKLPLPRKLILSSNLKVGNSSSHFHHKSSKLQYCQN